MILYNCGHSGFLNGLGMVTRNHAGAIAAGVIMLIIGVVFAALAAVQMIMLMKVLDSIDRLCM